MPFLVRAVCALHLLALGAAPALPASPGEVKSLTVYPNPVVLAGPRAEQHIGVLAEYADGRQAALSRQAALTVSSARVASVAGGIARPLADGATELTVRAGGKSVTV